MGLKLRPKEGDTALSEEELEQLIPAYITTREELDELEQDNIEEAVLWLLSLRSVPGEKLFSAEFQNLLHKKMLGKVWKWAGRERKTLTNLGVRPHQIAVERKKLHDDASVWLINQNWDPVETALRFHHRLVKIHCYPNGNGRHARLMADLILERVYRLQPLSWNYPDLLTENEGRFLYIAALRSADKGDYSLLRKSVTG